MNIKLPAGTLDRLWADDNNWRGGVIYVCKQDPRLIVPKRYWKWGGWTMNFAHRSAWLQLLAIMLTVIVPVGVCVAAGVANSWGWIVFSIVFIVLVCTLGAILSSPKWFENAP